MSKVYIYNQNCVMAGQECVDMELIDSYEESPDDFHDIHHYELDNLQEEIDYIEKKIPNMSAGNDLYWIKILNTLKGHEDDN